MAARTRTYRTPAGWDVRYDPRSRTGTAQIRNGGRPATFAVEATPAGDMAIFVGGLPPSHVISAVQRWIVGGCPTS